MQQKVKYQVNAEPGRWRSKTRKRQKEVQDFCQSGFLSGSGQMVDWVKINTSGGQFLPVRGLKGHWGSVISCSSNLVSLGGRCHIALV